MTPFHNLNHFAQAKTAKLASRIGYTALACLFSLQVDAATLIKNVRVFDGEKMLSPRQVLIDQGKILDANFKGSITPAMKIVDGSGRTLLPGLIDAHVHAFQDQDLPLLYGVTTQIDMFTAVSVMQDMNKRMVEGKNTQAPDLIAAGMLATAPKGHGTQFGMEIDTLTKPEQAQAWVDKRIGEGSHFIKIVMENGGIGYKFNSLDVATMQALIKATHARKKLAVVHISTYEDAKIALAAGANGLVHLFNGKSISTKDINDLTQLAKAKKAFVIPTFSVLESMAGLKSEDVLADQAMTSLLSKTQFIPLNTPYGKQVQADLLVAPRQLTAAMSAAKVPVLAGTDAGNSGTQFGISMHHEMASLVAAGLSPSAALQAATSAPAKAFRLNDRGAIRKGYKADLLLVEGDPSSDITATRRIVEIWKDGEIVSPLRTEKIAQVAKEKLQKKSVTELSADGRISLFSKAKLAGPFGFGWVPSNDAPMGGKSSVELSVAEPEANGQNPLIIKSTIRAGFAYPWAGVIFFPADKPMQAADLSAANTLKFKVKGDGQAYNVGFTMQGSFIPMNQVFTAGAEWQEISLPFSQFKGLDASMVTMLSFNAGPAVGDYQFQIMDVRLVKE
nr:CIA30 family protein [uncultured Undibacterium sp.]